MKINMQNTMETIQYNKTPILFAVALPALERKNFFSSVMNFYS